ncbi:BrnT family toxin [Nostoc sp.]|uniref:BrnT family toxin n=1 Tax=Nostoc sp. TaxID=1180 RepID=UPI002FF7FDBF
MEFEFYFHKSATNKTKHGIDFIEAHKLLADANFLEIPARTTDEPRFLVIGKIAEKYWSAVITSRGDKIRIISVRRSRTEKVNIYES